MKKLNIFNSENERNDLNDPLNKQSKTKGIEYFEFILISIGCSGGEDS